MKVVLGCTMSWPVGPVPIIPYVLSTLSGSMSMVGMRSLSLSSGSRIIGLVNPSEVYSVDNSCGFNSNILQDQPPQSL